MLHKTKTGFVMLSREISCSLQLKLQCMMKKVWAVCYNKHLAVPLTTIVGSFPCVMTTMRGRLLLTLSSLAIFIAISFRSSVC